MKETLRENTAVPKKIRQHKTKSQNRRKITKKGGVQVPMPSPKKETTDIPHSRVRVALGFLKGRGKNETHISNSNPTHQAEAIPETPKHLPIADSQRRTVPSEKYAAPTQSELVTGGITSPDGQPHVRHTITPATTQLSRKDLPQLTSSSVEQSYTRRLESPVKDSTHPDPMHQTTSRSVESVTAQAGAFSPDTNGHPSDAPFDTAPDDKDAQWQLSNIRKIIEEFYTDYPGMRGSDNEPLDNAMDHIVLQLGNMSRSMGEKDEALERATKRISLLDVELGRKQEESKRHQSEMQACDGKLKTMEHELSLARATINRNYEEFRRNGRSVEQKVKKLESENKTLQAAERERKRIKESYEKLLRQAKEDAAADSRRAQKLHQSNIESYRAHVTGLKRDVDWLEGQNKALKNDLYNAGFNSEKTVADLQKKISQLRISSEAEKLNLQKQLETQEATLNKQHQAKTQQLRSVNEEFRSALVAREHFKGLRDRDITGKFTRLATEVEDISTVEWISDGTADWPLSEEEMLRLHPSNIRLLKQQIVQSSIWFLLYEHIFRSPFRIMGSEGQHADEAWHGMYDSEDSFAWPEITADLEKMRYENARACLTAIEPSSRLSPDDRKLKDSFESAVARVLNDLHSALGKIAPLEDRDKKILDNIVRLCAKIWLECCSQRYRLLVILPDVVDNLLGSPQRQIGSLNLLIKPDIKRFGTSQGDDIATGEHVTGWKGLVECYPKR